MLKQDQEDQKIFDLIFEEVSIIIPGFDSEIPYIFDAKKDFEILGTKVFLVFLG